MGLPRRYGRRLSWKQNGFLASNLEHDLAVEDTEPFLLVRVDM